MADRKISDLTALTTPASGDYLPIVDISEAAAASKNKRITIEELMRGAPNGTAAAPSIAFESDPNTGIYSPGADQVAISTNGTGRLFVDSSGNVGIGTTSPSSLLHTQSASQNATSLVSTGSSVVLNMQCADTGSVTINAGGSTNPDKGRILYSDNSDFWGFYTADTERARIDSSGRLLVGTSTTAGYNHLLQVRNDSGAVAEFFTSSATTTLAPYLAFSRSRGSAGSPTVVSSGDNIGSLFFSGYSGSGYTGAAEIRAEIDGTPGVGDMPGRLVFSTTADGAATPTERMRITSAGVFQIADAGHITVGTTTGTKIGTATTQKIGFFNATPVVQPTAVADATDAATVITQLNALLTRMRNLGLIAT